MRSTRLAAGLAAAGVMVVTLASATSATDGLPTNAVATLKLFDGTAVGRVRFRERDGTTQVLVELEVPPTATAVRAFHGFHVHANDIPANGAGCVADPAAAPNTWFVSADGHLLGDAIPQVHGNHEGDMPPLHLDGDGRAQAAFTIDRIEIPDLDGRVVIVHAGADNLGNIPVGTAANEYTANSEAAVSLTERTGNAGDRIICGELAVR